jgi:hypothetical protein
MAEPARSQLQRKRDTLIRLEQEVDAWVATAGVESGTPYLIPLSFLWEGETLLISTPSSSPTSHNLLASGKVRLGIGPTRDLVLIEGSAEAVEMFDISDELGDAFAAKTGFDPRELSTPYTYFRIRPRRLQAWREANELEGREIMRGGEWEV